MWTVGEKVGFKGLRVHIVAHGSISVDLYITPKNINNKKPFEAVTPLGVTPL